jgi:hypothetical protein
VACAFAEEGDKGKALANLSLAFERKEHALKGEQMPDPRSDSSFQKYVRDEDFVRLMAKLGSQALAYPVVRKGSNFESVFCGLSPPVFGVTPLACIYTF